MSGLPADIENFYTETETVKWHDGVHFFTKRWIQKGSTRPRALILFLHGFAEHVERYDHVWPLFAGRGFEIFGYDQRGFGRSGPRYGDTTLKQQIVDLEYAVRRERERLDGMYGKSIVPIYLYGHSMGGGVILSLLTRPHSSTSEEHTSVSEMIRGVICGAPMILRTKPPSTLMLHLISWLTWIYPNMPLKKSLNPSHLTSDPEMVHKIASDPLFRGDICIKTISGMLRDGHKMLSEGYKNWPEDLPVLISHGKKDPSTSPEGSRMFVEKIGAKDKEFKCWPDMLHEGHNERAELREPFLEYSVRWLERRTPV